MSSVHFGASWGDLDRVLKPLERLLGPLGAISGGSRGVLGLLGGLLGGLGASWAPPRPTWRRPKPHKDNMRKKERATSRRKKKESTMFMGLHFEPQNRPKIATQTNQNRRRFSRAIKLLFESLLEPSWADLEPCWALSWGPKKCICIGKGSTGA